MTRRGVHVSGLRDQSSTRASAPFIHMVSLNCAFFVRPLFYYPLLVVSGGFACLRLRGIIIDNWRVVFVYLIEESVEFSIFLKSIFRLNHENMKKARATPAYRILITDCDWLRPIAGKSCDWLPASAGTWPPWPVQVTVTAAVIKLFRINIQAYK